MKEAPTPLKKTSYKEEEIKAHIKLDNKDIQYEVTFKQKNKEISIECKNIKNINEKYYYKLIEKEIIKFCSDITNFIDKLKANLDQLELKKNNDIILLIIRLDKNKKQEKLTLLMKTS